MNNDIKFLDIEWRTWYSLTYFEDHFGLRASFISYRLDPNICGFLHISVISNSGGQLAELIVYIIPLEIIRIFTRFYCVDWPQ